PTLIVALLASCHKNEAPKNEIELVETIDQVNASPEQIETRSGGFFSNDFRRGKLYERKTHPGLTRDEREITVIQENFDYPDGLVISGVYGSPREDGKASWGTESRGSLSKQPYCIGLIVHRARALPSNGNNSFHDHGVS